jgi:predicted nucleotidyltransferase
MSALLDTVLDTIRTRRVVGSVARGVERADSNVDIFAEISGRPTLFTIARAQNDLSRFDLRKRLSRRALPRSFDRLARYCHDA